jgi:hypothetical protein
VPSGLQERKKPVHRLVGNSRELFKETSLGFDDNGFGRIIEQLRAGLSPQTIDVIFEKNVT